MTREEALVVFELLEDGKTYTLIQRDGMVTLDWKQPDPETGAVRCGCGRMPERFGGPLSHANLYYTACFCCYFVAYGATQEIADMNWNKAMGYRKTPT